MIGLAGILASLALLIVLVYRGVPILLVAPAAAMLAAAAGEAPLLASYTQVFMAGVGRFVVLFFPVFLLGAVFGKLMESSGAAGALSEALTSRLGPSRAIMAVVIACAILTYGGVSLFVVAFAVFPIAASLFRSAGISPRLIPATIALGAFTFTMSALPGTPAIQNLIPMPFFGTTPFAAPGLGVVASTIMLAGGLAWLEYRRRGIDMHASGRMEAEPIVASGSLDTTAGDPRPGPSILVAIAPIATVLALNFAMGELVLPMIDTGYLTEDRWGGVSAEAVHGLWAIIVALTVASGLSVLLGRRRLPSPTRILEAGATASAIPMLNTASLVGYGAVVASLPGFDSVRAALLEADLGNSLVGLAVVVNALAGITGSASGGMTIALEAFAEVYAERAASEGFEPDLLHRISAIAAGGLDALPHNGAVVALLGVCGLNHRQAYGDVFVVAVALPVVALATVITLGSVFGGF